MTRNVALPLNLVSVAIAGAAIFLITSLIVSFLDWHWQWVSSSTAGRVVFTIVVIWMLQPPYPFRGDDIAQLERTDR